MREIVLDHDANDDNVQEEDADLMSACWEHAGKLTPQVVQKSNHDCCWKIAALTRVLFLPAAQPLRLRAQASAALSLSLSLSMSLLHTRSDEGNMDAMRR